MLLRFLLFIGLSLLAINFSTAQTVGRDSIIKVNKSDSLIEEVKLFAQKKNIFSKLLRNFIVFERKKAANTKKQESNRSYDKFEDRIIRNINVKVLDVFGATISDTNKVARSWFEKAGNSLHKSTLSWVIKQRLLFKSGQRVKPLEISESERVLRQYRNVYDARIYIEKLHKNRDSVDVHVLVQDIWSLTGSGSLDIASTSGDLSVKDVNFLGLGNELSGHVFYNRRDSVPWHYTLEYVNPNISHTFISGSIYYDNLPTALNYGVKLNRDFISPTLKWAGGIHINWLDDKRFVYDKDSSIVSSGFRNNQQDFWLGYATDLSSRLKENNYFSAVRILRTNYIQKPEADTFRITYQNNTLYLASIGYAYRRFIKDNFIFGLGRTEDVPLGKTLAFTVGYEDGDFFRRPYAGIKASHSFYRNGIGYFLGTFEWGGFRNNNNWQDVVFNTELLFYSKLISIGNWRWRHFFWNRLTYGYNTSPTKILTVNRREGVRGFSGQEVFGNKKYVINYESVFYTPFNLLGFRTAITLFADFAFISQKGMYLFNEHFVQGYGLGLRLRNEHLIFQTIQFSLGFYPRASRINEQTFKFLTESRTFYQFNRFQVTNPQIVRF